MKHQVELNEFVTQRKSSPFNNDVKKYERELFNNISNVRILIIGGAGSIGSSTIRQILKFKPKCLHVIDHDENGLAELVRDLRVTKALPISVDFKCIPIDFGNEICRRFLNDSLHYNYILNFAALKHVRSEKDLYSSLEMLNTNVVKQYNLTNWLSEIEFKGTYFSVSTDKAANPINLMGASKRLMELLLFQTELNYSKITSARFANVAFSNGSLLSGFYSRFYKRQVIAAPEGIQRYFVSLEEAGEICLLASFLMESHYIAIPNINQYMKEVNISDVAVMFLKSQGYQPILVNSEKEAFKLIEKLKANGEYPILLTKPDTSGEKMIEEFFGSKEFPEDINISSLLGLKQNRMKVDSVSRFIRSITHNIQNPSSEISKELLVSQLGELIPEFKHAETHRNLDDRI